VQFVDVAAAQDTRLEVLRFGGEALFLGFVDFFEPLTAAPAAPALHSASRLTTDSGTGSSSLKRMMPLLASRPLSSLVIVSKSVDETM
jgi:hypothetical protein